LADIGVEVAGDAAPLVGDPIDDVQASEAAFKGSLKLDDIGEVAVAAPLVVGDPIDDVQASFDSSIGFGSSLPKKISIRIQTTMFCQDYIFIFLKTKDHYY
jgi:histidinol phosphatase-like enzyme